MRPYSYEEAYELCQKMIELRNAIRNGNHNDIQSYHDLTVFCRFADEGVMVTCYIRQIIQHFVTVHVSLKDRVLCLRIHTILPIMRLNTAKT